MLFNPDYDNYTPLGNKLSCALEDYFRQWIKTNFVEGMNPRELELIARDAVMMAFLTTRLTKKKDRT